MILLENPNANVYAVKIKDFTYNGFRYAYLKMFIIVDNNLVEITENFGRAKRIKNHGWVLHLDSAYGIKYYVEQLNSELGINLAYKDCF